MARPKGSGVTPAPIRFWAKVDKNGSIMPNMTTKCWLWTAWRNAKGYGMFCVSEDPREHLLAHRYAYELMKGPIPDHKPLDHLCRNHACVNPDHLEPVTLRENNLRGEGLAAISASKTHCPQGHPYTIDNLVRWEFEHNGYRVCHLCYLETQKRMYAQRAYRKKYQRAASPKTPAIIGV